MLVTQESLRIDQKIEYDGRLAETREKLSLALSAIKTMKEKYGLTVGPGCIETISNFCALPTNSMISSCRSLSAKNKGTSQPVIN
jgi:hypothetical protein